LSELQVIRGRIVDLRRYINAHVYWRRPPGPTERYELWVSQLDTPEFKITIHTQAMPARPGHTVSVIVKRSRTAEQVLGLFNASTLGAVNYVRSDPPPLFRMWEFVALPAVFVGMGVWLGDAGIVLSIVAAVAYLLLVSSGRAIARALCAARVAEALHEEAARIGCRPTRLRFIP
jgi:hypothetical protein